MQPLRRIAGVRNAAGRPEKILKIGLQLPPWCDLILVGRLNHRFSTALRKTGRRKRSGILIKTLRARPDLGVANSETDNIIVAALERRFQGDTRVHAEVDQVAVTRCAHYSREHADRLRTVGAWTPDHLIRNGVDAVVAAMACGNSVGSGIG